LVYSRSSLGVILVGISDQMPGVSVEQDILINSLLGAIRLVLIVDSLYLER